VYIKGALHLDISELNVILSPEKEINVSNNKVHLKPFTNMTSKVFRRTIDIFVGLFGVLALIPITLLVYCINKFSKQSGKIFFIQERIGINGKIFKMYKFRTMIENADQKLKELLEENEELKKEYKKYKKLKNDPRITNIGKVLRKTSLDEFPQFINILKGDMSLIGPRPYLLREKDDMGEAYNTIIKCKPGLTGKWQVSGRSGTTFDDRLNMDIDYCKNRTIKGDAKILFKTIIKTIIKEGAL